MVDASSILSTVLIPNENIGLSFTFSKEICYNEVKFSFTGNHAVTLGQVLSKLYHGKTF